MKYDIVIIGSGLGGLECAYILSKRGYSVCILEKSAQLGGCLQTFRRNGTTFDTGFHYVGGLDPGQSLHALFRYFDLLALPWHRMDEACFAEVVIAGKSYRLASGHERFVDTLATDFPNSHPGLKRYAGFLRGVGDGLADAFRTQADNRFFNTSLFEQSAYGFLQENIGDPLLRSVLSGASLTMELCPDYLPLYVFAQINNSFIQSAWRLAGGGSQIADRLADSIRAMGGTILTKAEATRLIDGPEGIEAVEYNGAERVEGRWVISDLHPALTLTLIPESRFLRKIYRKRIMEIHNTFGMFTTHLQLKPDSEFYVNRNVFLYETDDPWSLCRYKSGVPAVMVNWQVPTGGETATRNIDLLTPMYWEEVERWSASRIGHRGSDYEAFKQQKAEACIALAEKRLPGLRDRMEKHYTSTPLTYRDYTGTWNGSAFGIRKDYRSPMLTILAPQTPIPNLLLTGQNLNLHGVLGVTMTSFFTAGRITGLDDLVKELNL